MSGHQLGVLGFNSTLTLSEVCADPTGKGLGPQDRPPLQIPVTSTGAPGYPHFCPTGLQCRDSWDPILRLDDLLERLTDRRKVVYLLSPGYHKGYKSEAADWKRCIGRGRGEVVWSLHALSGCITLPACSPTQELSEPHRLGSLGGGSPSRRHD